MTIQTSKSHKQQICISDIIEERRISQRRSKAWLSRETGEYYKTLYDKIKFDRFTDAYLFLKIAKLLNIDLNELRDRI